MVPHRYSLRHRFGFLWTKGVWHQSLRLLVFFCIAVVLWVLVTLNRPHETQFRFPISIKNVPANVELLEPLPTEFTVTSKGEGMDLLLAHLRRRKDTFPIFFQSESNREVFTAQDYLPNIQQYFRHLSAKGIQVIEVAPDEIVVAFEPQGKKRVALRNRLQYTFPPAYQLAYAEIVSPDSVTLMAPERMLDSIHEWYTSNRVVEIGNDTTTFKVPLDTLKGLFITPNEATVFVKPSAYTQKKLQLSLKVIDTPDDLQVNLSHLVLDLVCVVPLDQYDELEGNYVLEVSYRELDQEIPYFVPNASQALPPAVKIVSRSPLQVSYVIVNMAQ